MSRVTRSVSAGPAGGPEAAGRSARQATLLALGAATGALAVALAAPHLFSDPNGLDPHVLRLSAVAVVLAGASLAVPRLAATRPVLLAVAAVTTSFSAFSAAPRLLTGILGDRLSGPAQLFWASALQLAVTAGFVALVARASPAPLRPDVRLLRFDPRALAISVAGIAGLLLAGILVPAPLLGREGIALPAVARDLPWLAPACTLQALSQEVQFRGLLLGALERVTSPGRANLAQAALFGLAHLAIQYPGPIAPFVPVTLALGLLFGLAAQRLRSLWPAVLVHAAGDVGITASVLPGLYGLT